MNARHPSRLALRAALEAALVIAIGMGAGRFAFTAAYPYMVQEGLLDLQSGSLAASANYAGYLLGALLVMGWRGNGSHHLCLWATFGTCACLAALAMSTSVHLIVAVRAIAGVFSALAMVAASVWLLEQRRYTRQAPLLYAGVGLGIVLSAELMVLGNGLGLDSQALWWVLACTCLVIGLAVAPGLLSGQTPARQKPQETPDSSAPPSKPLPLVVIYGLSGLGYIITATYLPLLVRTALPELDPAHVWALFGLGAIPSCFFWHRVQQRLGTRRSLTLNLSVQATGVILPVLLPSPGGYLLSAVLVGGTFMGTVTIAVPAARLAARQLRCNLIAIMTLAYGLGQIIGPLLASALFSLSQTFASSLLMATSALLLAALLCWHRLKPSG